MPPRDKASDFDIFKNAFIALGDGLSAHATEIALTKHKIARSSQAAKASSSSADKKVHSVRGNDQIKVPGSVPLLNLIRQTPQLDTTTEKNFKLSQPVKVETSSQSQKVIPISPKELQKKVQQESQGEGDYAFADITNGVPGKSFFEKYSFKGVPKDQRPNAVILAVDCSWSVLQPDDVLTEYRQGKIVRQSIKHTRWEYVLNSVRKILETLPADMPVGIRIFGAEPIDKQDYNPVCRCHNSQLIEKIRPNRPQGQESVFHHFMSRVPEIKPIHETPIPFAIEQAIKSDLKGIKGKKLVIGIGDGKSTCGDPRKTIKKLKNDPDAKDVEMDVHAVMPDKQTENEMGDLAQAGRGKFYKVDKKTVKETIHNRKFHATGATILPSTKDSQKLINSRSEMNWDEEAEK
jgi:hypothetical protein